MRDKPGRVQPEDEPGAAGAGARWDVWPAIPSSARRILDLGCGAGGGFSALRSRGICVIGGDINPIYVERARAILDDAQLIDVEQNTWPDGWDSSFDAVIYADVLEHLVDPWESLRQSRSLLAPGGCIIASIPNVRQWRLVVKLALFGTWDYRVGAGTLQREHVRFFTRRTIQLMFDECAYRTEFLWPRPTFHLRKMERVVDALTARKFSDLLFYSYTVRGWPI